MMSNTYSNPPATPFLIHAHYYTVNLGYLSPPPAHHEGDLTTFYMSYWSVDTATHILQHATGHACSLGPRAIAPEEKLSKAQKPTSD